MKRCYFISLALSFFYQMGLSQKASREININHDVHGMFIDLNAADLIDLCYDSIHHKTINPTNDREIFFFIDTESGDTIYGRGRYIVNGHVIREKNNRYHLDSKVIVKEQGRIRLKSNEAQLKISGCKIRFKNFNLTKSKGDRGHESENKDAKTRFDSVSKKNQNEKMKDESAKK